MTQEKHLVNPATGKPWTQAELDSAECGYWRVPYISPESGMVRAPSGYRIIRNGVDCGIEAEFAVGDVLQLRRADGAAPKE